MYEDSPFDHVCTNCAAAFTVKHDENEDIFYCPFCGAEIEEDDDEYPANWDEDWDIDNE